MNRVALLKSTGSLKELHELTETKISHEKSSGLQFKKQNVPQKTEKVSGSQKPKSFYYSSTSEDEPPMKRGRSAST
uniref:Ovule protein n=1 Tax=Caenorhabditis tropicalis TaxID=1561998 RepID=A0A1I7TR29_9PELO